MALAVLLVAANVGFVASFLGLRHEARRVKESDHRNYVAMTRAYAGDEASARARTAPYCWRILVPAMAAGLVRSGIEIDTAYYGLTIAALWGWLAVLFALLRGQGFDLAQASVGTTLAALTPAAVRWYLYQYWMTDPMAMFLVALGILLVERGHWRALALVSLPGVLTRESYVLVFVWALAREWRRAGGLAAVRRVSAASVVPLVTLVAVRLLVEPQAGGGLLATLRFVLGFRWRHLFDNQIYFASLGTFGALLPLALAGWLARRRLPRAGTPDLALLLATYASLLLAVNTDRLLVYALPVLLPWAVHGFAELSRRETSRSTALAAVVVAIQALLYVETRFGPRAISIYQPTSWSVTAACLLFAVWATVASLRRRAASAAHAPVDRRTLAP